jgi:urease accessory protein
VVFGRTAMGEIVRDGLFADRWRVRRDGRLIFAENFRLDGAIAAHLTETAVAKGHTALAAVLIAPGDEAAVATVRAATERFRGDVGVSAWSNSGAPGIALARLAAPDGALVRHDLAVLLAALGHALPRNWLH